VKIIHDHKIDLQALKKCIDKPPIFQKGNAKFWDDQYISEQMLKLHLNPEIESASKTMETIKEETRFIIEQTAMSDKKTVLDLGCGPGLYVKEFAKTGAKVIGLDISHRAIDYANATIKPDYENTAFYHMNYLDMEFKGSFDVATLIFYDFCALDPGEQSKLLVKVHEALGDHGVFIFDVVSQYKKPSAATSITVCEGGFWSPDPYLEILEVFLYEDPKTEGLQYTIISEDGTSRIIRIYHRLFGLAEITRLLNCHHFRVEKIYENLKGEKLKENAETYGIIARKV